MRRRPPGLPPAERRWMRSRTGQKYRSEANGASYWYTPFEEMILARNEKLGLGDPRNIVRGHRDAWCPMWRSGRRRQRDHKQGTVAARTRTPPSTPGARLAARLPRRRADGPASAG